MLGHNENPTVSAKHDVYLFRPFLFTKHIQADKLIWPHENHVRVAHRRLFHVAGNKAATQSNYHKVLQQNQNLNLSPLMP